MEFDDTLKNDIKGDTIDLSKENGNEKPESKEDNKIELPPKPEKPTFPPIIEVPPVPMPPKLAPETSTADNHFDEKKKDLVAHLDPALFQRNRRYYALMSNNIVDPQFVGPNAPGIVLNSHNNGNGLATAYSGTASLADRFSTGVLNSSSGHTSKNVKKVTSLQSSKASSTNTSQPKPSGILLSKSKKVSVSSTGSSMHLKKIMEWGGPEADAMRYSIIRAAQQFMLAVQGLMVDHL